MGEFPGSISLFLANLTSSVVATPGLCCCLSDLARVVLVLRPLKMDFQWQED